MHGLLVSCLSNQDRCSPFSWAGITSSVLLIPLSWMLDTGYRAPASALERAEICDSVKAVSASEPPFLSPIRLGHASDISVKIMSGKIQCLAHSSHPTKYWLPPTTSSPDNLLGNFHTHQGREPCQGLALHVRNGFHSYTFYADGLLGVPPAVSTTSWNSSVPHGNNTAGVSSPRHHATARGFFSPNFKSIC